MRKDKYLQNKQKQWWAIEMAMLESYQHLVLGQYRINNWKSRDIPSHRFKKKCSLPHIGLIFYYFLIWTLPLVFLLFWNILGIIEQAKVLWTWCFLCSFFLVRYYNQPLKHFPKVSFAERHFHPILICKWVVRGLMYTYMAVPYVCRFT